MANEEAKTTEVTTEVTETKPVKVKDPVKELKKEVKKLNEDLREAQTAIEAYEGVVNSLKAQLDQKDRQLNGLAAEYSRITNYIKDTLKVAHQSILMVMKEGN